MGFNSTFKGLSLNCHRREISVRLIHLPSLQHFNCQWGDARSLFLTLGRRNTIQSTGGHRAGVQTFGSVVLLLCDHVSNWWSAARWTLRRVLCISSILNWAGNVTTQIMMLFIIQLSLTPSLLGLLTPDFFKHGLYIDFQRYQLKTTQSKMTFNSSHGSIVTTVFWHDAIWYPPFQGRKLITFQALLY